MLMRRRPLMRAGMIAGTAYAANRAGKRSTERAYQESEQEQRLAALEAQAAPPPPPAPVAPAPVAAAAPADSGLVGELTKLKGLLDAGVLTQEEFDAAKAKLLST